MASPRGKKKMIFNEESGTLLNTGTAPLLDISAINEEGMYENLTGAVAPRRINSYNSNNEEKYVNLSGALAPRLYNSNNNVEKARPRRRSRATARHLPLIIDLESPNTRNNNGASSPTRLNYAFSINEETGSRRARKHSKSPTRRRRKRSNSHTRRNKNKVKIE